MTTFLNLGTHIVNIEQIGLLQERAIEAQAQIEALQRALNTEWHSHNQDVELTVDEWIERR